MRLSLIILTFVFHSFNSIEAQSTASKQVNSFWITAPLLETEKQIWIYLPKDYKNSLKNYPVMYMHDAQNLFDEELAYAGEWHVDDYLDQHSKKQCIVVGIAHGNEKRLDELTPFPNSKYGGGKGDAYLHFIKNTLKPHVDSVYRTKTRPKDTMIFGSSLGGLISFYAVLKFPETFGKAGVFSPSFWINPELYDYAKTSDLPKNSKFYFLAGTKESESMIPKLNEMIQLLKSKGLSDTQFKKRLIDGGEHNEKLWSENFGEAYQWLMAN